MEQSIKSLFDLYISRNNLADSTIAIRARAIRFFVECFGDIDVSSVTFGHAEDYRGYLARDRNPGGVNVYISNIRPFFSWLAKRGHISVDPFATLKRLKVAHVERKVYTPDEIQRMIKVSNLKWQAMILLGLCSGLRRSEVLNLVTSDIDFERSNILLSPKRDTDHTWRWEIKNRDQSYAPLPEIVQLPETFVNLHGLLRLVIELSPPTQPYVFLKPELYKKLLTKKANGTLTFEERISPWGNFTRDFRGILKRALVKPARFHDLRRTFATSMVEAGLTVKETQTLMRHSSASTTLSYYIHADKQQVLEKGNTISSKCFGLKSQNTRNSEAKIKVIG